MFVKLIFLTIMLGVPPYLGSDRGLQLTSSLQEAFQHPSRPLLNVGGCAGVNYQLSSTNYGDLTEHVNTTYKTMTDPLWRI